MSYLGTEIIGELCILKRSYDEKFPNDIKRGMIALARKVQRMLVSYSPTVRMGRLKGKVPGCAIRSLPVSNL